MNQQFMKKGKSKNSAEKENESKMVIDRLKKK